MTGTRPEHPPPGSTSTFGETEPDRVESLSRISTSARKSRRRRMFKGLPIKGSGHRFLRDRPPSGFGRGGERDASGVYYGSKHTYRPRTTTQT